MTNEFLSLDWGTSSFRLRLVATAGLQVLAEKTSDQGIAGTFQLWQQAAGQERGPRLAFYTRIIAAHIAALEKESGRALQGLPVLVSGMASSSIGLQELPYRHLPFAVDGTNIEAALLPASPGFPHEIFLISGVRSADDVMRGEETQLIGGFPELEERAAGQIFIFPGTHSKHVRVQGRQAVAFKTYMTGEFFELLAKKSILSATVAPPAALAEGPAAESFNSGVQAAVGANLLHAAFLVRTNHLFGVWDREKNFHYLSGLLIGTELQELLPYAGAAIYLMGGAKLQPYYEQALAVLGLKKVRSFPAAWADQAVVRGQYRIYQQHRESNSR